MAFGDQMSSADRVGSSRPQAAIAADGAAASHHDSIGNKSIPSTSGRTNSRHTSNRLPSNRNKEY